MTISNNLGGWLVGYRITYTDGTTRQTQIALPGVDQQAAIRTGAAYIKRAAPRKIESIDPVCLGPASPGQFPKWVLAQLATGGKYGISVDWVRVGIGLGL